MNKALLISALVSHAQHAINNCISPKEEQEMTPTMEDVIRWDEESGLFAHKNGDADVDQLRAFATLARADLVAENEQLKAELSKHIATPQYREARKAEVAVVTRQLQESQAREAKLRELLEVVAIAPLVSDFGLPKYGISIPEMRDIQHAIALQSNDTALRELIAGVYEECAKRSDSYSYMSANFTALAEEFRALAEKAKGK